MGDALGEDCVIKDDMIHSNRALSEGIITVEGNADGSTHAMQGKFGGWNESSIVPLGRLPVDCSSKGADSLCICLSCVINHILCTW